MDPDLRRELLDLSADFYSAHADTFDRTRQNPWHSWSEILSIAQQRTVIRNVLDIGCGNGRYAAFLDDNQVEANYTGVDAEKRFIDLASIRYPDKEFIIGTIEEALDNKEEYDLIVSFGVFHHIPGRSYRQELLDRLGDRLNDNGIIALSLWQPKLVKNFTSKAKFNPNINGLEENDFLLGWNGDFSHLRYCHHFEDDEIEALITQTNLDLVVQFQGSGNDASNRYVLLTRS